MSQNWFPLNHPITENSKGDYRRHRWPSLYQFISHQFSFLGEFSPASSQRREQGSENLPLLSWRRPSTQKTRGMFALGIKPLAPKPRGMVQIPPYTPGQEDFALWLVESHSLYKAAW